MSIFFALFCFFLLFFLVFELTADYPFPLLQNMKVLVIQEQLLELYLGISPDNFEVFMSRIEQVANDPLFALKCAGV